MVIVRINPQTNKIVGRSREQTDANCIEVSDELWGRIVGDMSAFEFVPETRTIELRAEYKGTPVQEFDIKNVERYTTEIQEMISVPELNIQITLGGIFGRVLLAAIALAQYVPQTLLCTDLSGKFVVVTIDKAACELIAAAVARHSESILNTGEDSDE